ncbi:unnamed protein product, partial [Darwinula stevensoni]
MPLRKDQVEQLAWGWVEGTIPEEIQNEHVLMAYCMTIPRCSSGSCKRNCKWSPFCLNGVGAEKWMKGLPKTEAPNLEETAVARNPELFVGLKNLGATCYVNSLLQLWFHTPEFRQDQLDTFTAKIDYDSSSDQGEDVDGDAGTSHPQKRKKKAYKALLSAHAAQEEHAIFSWNPAEDATEDSNLCLPEVNIQPRSVIGNLLQLFAFLQFSNSSFVDPTEFIQTLALDKDIQQDAEEFSQLFLHFLQGQLSSQTNESVSGLVPTLYEGEYSYVTRCLGCQTETERPDTFLELTLNVKGETHLEGSLNAFLREEFLEGENQYMCNVCQKKQDSVRRIRITRFPPILNVHLLRFVFNRSERHQEFRLFCISPPIEFLDIVSLSRQKGQRTKVTSLLSFPVSLDLSKYCEQPRGSLVYQLFSILIHAGSSAHSGHYIAYIQDLTSGNWFRFNDEVVCEMNKRNPLANVDSDSARPKPKEKGEKGPSSSNAYMLVYRRQVPELTGKEKYGTELTLEGLPPWLRKMVDKHNFSVQKALADLESMKACEDPHSSEFLNEGDVIFSLFGGGPRITEGFLCRSCVTRICGQRRLRQKLSQQEKQLRLLFKKKVEGNDPKAHWVGKKSLRIWRNLVMDQVLGSTQPDSLEAGNDENGSINDDDDLTAFNDEDATDVNMDGFQFNDDLLCCHQALIPDPSVRRLIPEDAWEILRDHFPQAPDFLQDSPICSDCQAVAIDGEFAREENRTLAIKQKSLLGQLYLRRDRPVPGVQPSVYLINANFLDAWTAFIRDPRRKNAVVEINNASMVCPHDMLPFNPLLHDPDHSWWVPVWDWEYDIMMREFDVDIPITVSACASSDSSEPAGTFVPAVCEECQSSWLEEKEKQLLEYRNVCIFVRRLPSADDALSTGSREESSDDNASCSETRAKIPRLEKSFNGVNVEELTGILKLNDDVGHRRSQRQRRTVGEKAVRVSSDMTLRDLKLQVMKVFGVPPFDQHLFLSSKELEGDDSTLADLRIFPDCHITLL